MSLRARLIRDTQPVNFSNLPSACHCLKSTLKMLKLRSHPRTLGGEEGTTNSTQQVLTCFAQCLRAETHMHPPQGGTNTLDPRSEPLDELGKSIIAGAHLLAQWSTTETAHASPQMLVMVRNMPISQSMARRMASCGMYCDMPTAWNTITSGSTHANLL